MADNIRVLIADDDDIIREGLANLLGLQDDLDIVAVVKNGAEAVEMCGVKQVDVALLDVDMPIMNGVDAAKQIAQKSPGTAVVMLTAFQHEDSLADAIASGVRGFLTKDIPVTQLAEYVRQAYEGQTVMGSKPANILSKAYIKSAQNREQYSDFIERVHGLPERLKPVFNLLLEARTNSEIAKDLHMSEATVRSYVSDILELTGCVSRGELAVTGLKAGFESV